MAGRKILGESLQLARKLATLNGLQAVVNTTQTRELLALPPGAGPHRIEFVAVSGSVVPADADGTFLLNVSVYDSSEVASDNIVVNQDLETLITVAHKSYLCALAAEGAEKERIIEGGDSIWLTLVNNSAAVEANPFLAVTVALIPLDQQGDKGVRRRQMYNP